MSSGNDSDRDTKVRNSSYYLEKFGSRSPEEYKSLRITNIDSKIGEHDLDNVLRKLFSRYGEMHCKVVNPRDVHERIAYVNFDYAEDARDARTKGAGKILTTLGRKVRVDPANVVRDQGGKMLRKDSESRKSRSPPPQPDRHRDSYSARPRIIDHRTRQPAGRSPPPYRGGGRGGYDMSPPPEFEHPRPTWDYKEGDSFEDSFASRTLFVGNLEIDIGISEIRHFFEKYGTVEEIDIKTPQNGITAYAFVRFSDILSAREARKHCSGEYLRDNRCIIGWGKPIVTRRLWVGGFTSDISLSWLEKEFDRFGPVEKIDFNRGETHAFVLYADQRAATEAFRKLRGLRTKNGVLENSFHVDYADASMYERTTLEDRPRRRSHSRSRSPSDRNRSSKRRRSNSGSRSPPARKRNASSDRDESANKSRRRDKDSSSKKDNGRSGRRRSSSSASPHRRRNGAENNGSSGGKNDNVYSSPATQRQTGLVAAAELAADSLQDLHEIKSPIWTGVLVLKKSAYPLQLFKMAGDDDLVDAYLRNERGESVQLNITQRYKLDQPRTGEILRVSASAMEHCAYLLAVPNPNVRQDLVEKLADLQSKHLKCLVEYFEEKNAAGVINVSASGSGKNNVSSSKIATQGVAYAFPHCSFADDFVATLCPKLAVWQKCKDECLLVVLQKSSPSSQTAE